MNYFRLGCVTLCFFAIPAFASELDGVPGSGHFFWFCIFPAICLFFPVLLGAIISRENFLGEYLICAMIVLITHVPFIVEVYSHSYFLCFILVGVIQTVIPVLVHGVMLTFVSDNHPCLAKRVSCISGASFVITLCVWLGAKYLLKY